MDFSGFIKENPQMVGQAMGSMGGGEKQQSAQGPAYDTPLGASEGVRQTPDTGDKGYDGFKNVVKTVASFYVGGAAGAAGKGGAAAGASGGTAANAAQQGVSMGVSGNGQQAPVQGSPGYQATDTERAPGYQQPTYQQTAQQTQQQPWFQQWAGGYGG